MISQKCFGARKMWIYMKIPTPPLKSGIFSKYLQTWEGLRTDELCPIYRQFIMPNSHDFFYFPSSSDVLVNVLGNTMFQVIKHIYACLQWNGVSRFKSEKFYYHFCYLYGTFWWFWWFICRRSETIWTASYLPKAYFLMLTEQWVCKVAEYLYSTWDWYWLNNVIPDWRVPHNDCHIISVIGDVIPMEHNYRLPSDINSHAFSKYTGAYFKVGLDKN